MRGVYSCPTIEVGKVIVSEASYSNVGGSQSRNYALVLILESQLT